MRHRKSVPKLSRTASHRKALLMNLASALIIAKKIKTTTTKAKALRTYIEPLITRARKGDVHARRIVLKTLHNKDVVKELFDEIAPTFIDRPGGYTRITKLGQRASDSAEMAMIELIGFESAYKAKKEESQEKRSKRKEEKAREAKEAQEEAMAEVEEAPEEKEEENK